jgi:ABC-type nitrate/sulfonate/bicarbonate transport system ATPase subunit
MEVIFHAVDAIKMAIFVFGDSIDKRVKVAFVVQNHCLLSFIGAINNVIYKLSMCAHKKLGLKI